MQAISCVRQEQPYRADIAAKKQAQRDAHRALADAAIAQARARGADESWINFHLSMHSLPGHPDTRW